MFKQLMTCHMVPWRILKLASHDSKASKYANSYDSVQKIPDLIRRWAHMLIYRLCCELINEPRREKTRSLWFPTRHDTNRAVQQQKMVRGIKFRI